MKEIDEQNFRKYYKGKIRSSRATIDQYIYFLNQFTTLPTNPDNLQIGNLNKYLKKKVIYSWQIGSRSAFIRWIEFLCSRPECTTNYNEIEHRLKKSIYIPRRPEYRHRDKGLTENQVIAVIKNVLWSIDEDALKKLNINFPLYEHIILGLDTGLRRKEESLLEFKHIDVSDETRPKLCLSEDITKIKEYREVPFRPETWQLLKKYLITEKYIDDKLKPLKKTNTKIFILRDIKNKEKKNQLIRITQLYQRLHIPMFDRRRFNQPVIPVNFHPHKVRHTFAKMMSKKGDIRVTQILLGHKRLSTTDIYIGAKDFKKAEEVYRS